MKTVKQSGYTIPDAENPRLAFDTIRQKECVGVPTYGIHIMEHSMIDFFAGKPPGSYLRNPEKTYLALQRRVGTCLLDQFIPDNPLTMGDHGYENAEKGATTGADTVMANGTLIDRPEAVVEHMEGHVFPDLKRRIRFFDGEKLRRDILKDEEQAQKRVGPTILKTGYGFIDFPRFAYKTYGYVNYFTAYALYPDRMEKHFALQADLAILKNRVVSQIYADRQLPPHV
jgi:hypothetical protein